MFSVYVTIFKTYFIDFFTLENLSRKFKLKVIETISVSSGKLWLSLTGMNSYFEHCMISELDNCWSCTFLGALWTNTEQNLKCAQTTPNNLVCRLLFQLPTFSAIVFCTMSYKNWRSWYCGSFGVFGGTTSNEVVKSSSLIFEKLSFKLFKQFVVSDNLLWPLSIFSPENSNCPLLLRP